MFKHFSKICFLFLSVAFLGSQIVFAQQWDKNRPPVFDAPPQDKGLPYTQSGYANARKSIKEYIAVFAGSKYAYVKGYKFRLDTKDVLRGEALAKNGKVFVPKAFAGFLTLKKINPKPIPVGLELLERKWVYELDRPKVEIPASVEQFTKNNIEYICLNDLATALGKKIYQNKRGLLLISDKEIAYNDNDKTLSDAVVTIFDTPEKYMEPDLATENIPLLKFQGKWTEHAKYTPEQEKELMDGEIYNDWERPQPKDYDLTGFNKNMLGSKVPAPNVYPRLLFSPEDIPMMKKLALGSKINRISMMETEIMLKKTWLDSTTDDGKVFNKLVKGDIAEFMQTVTTPGLSSMFPNYKAGIYSSHIKYIPNCLISLAFYALITENNALGTKTAKAVYNYIKIIEPFLDAQLKRTDSEIGISSDEAQNSETHWRGIHGIVPHMDLPFMLDFSGKWMNVSEKKYVQNFIAKATYGRRTGAGDSPNRLWRDINHMTWHLTHHLAIATIEGLDGFDPEAYASGCELTKDFLDFGIDKYGQIFESNGKSGGGIIFQLFAMIIQDRRGEKLWGHPHWRKLVNAQIYTDSPNKKETLSTGTWGGSPFSDYTYSMFKVFYPEMKGVDYMLEESFSGEGTVHVKSFSPGVTLEKFDTSAYRKKLEKNISRIRLPNFTNVGGSRSFPYNADWDSNVKREDLGLNLDWNDDEHGILSTSSDNTSKAAWLCLHVRANHYFGSGHHHSDIGMFYFSSGGVNWITESPFPKTYAGNFHNLVIVDGKSEPNTPPAKGTYIGAKLSPSGAFGSVDQAYSYSYQWCAQVQTWGTGFAKTDSIYGKDPWELETDPYVMKFYRGTGRYKVRSWWPSNNFSNYMPNLRAPWNPMEYVYRSTGLVRGKHPYALIVDDLKKDANKHKYEWTVMLAKGVWKAELANLPKNVQVLAYRDSLLAFWKKTPENQAAIKPKKGEQLLLVYPLGLDAKTDTNKVFVANDGNWDGEGAMVYNKLAIVKNDIKVNYKVLLIPYTMGEALPKITETAEKAIIQWADQTDEIYFKVNNNRTSVSVNRDGKEVVGSK